MKWFFVDSFFAKVLNERKADSIIALGAGFIGVYSTWHSEWDIFKDSKAWWVLYWFVLIVGAVILTFRSVSSWIPRPPDPNENYIESLESLLESVSRIITAKTERFRSKVHQITGTGDAFEIITQPKDQIKVIITEAIRYFPSRIGTGENQLDITVLVENDPDEWKFMATSNDTWMRASPETILNGRSLARRCLSSGEPCFIADKRLASDEGRYIYSQRDRDNNLVGSAFCAPILFEIGDVPYRYLVTFSTYGIKICEPDDDDTIAIATQLFLEFVKRIELELLLNSIKTHKHYLKRQTNEKPAGRKANRKVNNTKPASDKS